MRLAKRNKSLHSWQRRQTFMLIISHFWKLHVMLLFKANQLTVCKIERSQKTYTSPDILEAALLAKTTPRTPSILWRAAPTRLTVNLYKRKIMSPFKEFDKGWRNFLYLGYINMSTNIWSDRKSLIVLYTLFSSGISWARLITSSSRPPSSWFQEEVRHLLSHLRTDC